MQNVCTDILNGVRSIDGTGPIARLAGALQRKTYWIGSGYKSHFSISKERCIDCGLCYRICPSENISINENGDKVFVNNWL